MQIRYNYHTIAELASLSTFESKYCIMLYRLRQSNGPTRLSPTQVAASFCSQNWAQHSLNTMPVAPANIKRVAFQVFARKPSSYYSSNSHFGTHLVSYTTFFTLALHGTPYSCNSNAAHEILPSAQLHPNIHSPSVQQFNLPPLLPGPNYLLLSRPLSNNP